MLNFIINLTAKTLEAEARATAYAEAPLPAQASRVPANVVSLPQRADGDAPLPKAA